MSLGASAAQTPGDHAHVELRSETGSKTGTTGKKTKKQQKIDEMKAKKAQGHQA